MVSGTGLKVESLALTPRLPGPLTKITAERRPRVVRGPLSSMRLSTQVLSLAIMVVVAQVLSKNAVLPVAGRSTMLVAVTIRLLGKRSSVVVMRRRARVLPSTRHHLQGEGALSVVVAPRALSSLQGSFTLRERSAIALTTVREGMAGAVSSGAILRSIRESLSRMTR